MIEEKFLLTIGIPSFNRGPILLETLEKMPLLPELQLLIVNDGSPHLQYQAVESFIATLINSRIVHYQENYGPPTALIRLFENCETQYLMLLSDEDLIVPRALGKLHGELDKEEFSYIVLRDIKRKTNVKSIKWLSAYFSGNVFKVSDCMEALKFIKELAKNEEFAHLYPHSLLAIFLAAQGKKHRHIYGAGHIVRTVTKTEIRTLSGKHAEKPTERVLEHLSFLRCLDEMAKLSGLSNSVLSNVKNSARTKFFGSLLDSVSTVDSRAVDDLLRGVAVTYLTTSFRIFIKKLRQVELLSRHRKI